MKSKLADHPLVFLLRSDPVPDNFFDSRDGSSILKRRDGRIAWWISAEGLLVERAPSFDAFARIFADFRIHFPGKAYDPYSDAELLGAWGW